MQSHHCGGQADTCPYRRGDAPVSGFSLSPFSQGCFAVASSRGSLSFTRLRRVCELDGKRGRRPWSSEHSHWTVLVLRLRPALLCHGVVGPPEQPSLCPPLTGEEVRARAQVPRARPRAQVLRCLSRSQPCHSCLDFSICQDLVEAMTGVHHLSASLSICHMSCFCSYVDSTLWV